MVGGELTGVKGVGKGCEKRACIHYVPKNDQNFHNIFGHAGAAACNPRSTALLIVASHTITVRAYPLTASGSDQGPTQSEAQALTQPQDHRECGDGLGLANQNGGGVNLGVGPTTPFTHYNPDN